MSTEIEKSEFVFRWIAELLKNSPFPEDGLRNRLTNLGLKEFVDGDVSPSSGQKVLAVTRFGFPFKFSSQIDEAILALGYFLERFVMQEESGLKVSAVSRLPKGQDKSLGYWQTAKAKLYMELQNLILLLNGFGDRKSEVTRIFAFRQIEDLAYLTQPGMAALSEQVALGIKVGFLFLDSFEQHNQLEPHNGQAETPLIISNCLFVEFTPPQSQYATQPLDSEETELLRKSARPRLSTDCNFYEIVDQTKQEHLPYEERCFTKWLINTNESNNKYGLMELFERSRWSNLNRRNSASICEFPEGEFFNQSTVLMLKAAEIPEDIVKRITETVITPDFIELERAMSCFDQTDEIWAIDATSAKNTLQIHLSNPIYRQWIRKSLNRVLKSALKGGETKLNRIYIIRDERKDADREFAALLQEMQYYFDYFHFEISEMRASLTAHHDHSVEMEDSPAANHDSGKASPKLKHSLTAQHESDVAELSTDGPSLTELENVWRRLSQLVNIRVTTSSILKGTSLPDDLSKMCRDLFKEEVTTESLAKLDVLYTPNMIYNFINQRADPGELEFEAHLFRKHLSVDDEYLLLFGFAKDDKRIDNSLREICRARLRSLLDSLLAYEDKYPYILAEEIKRHSKTLKKLTRLFKRGNPTPLKHGKQLLEIRKEFEETLFSSFYGRFQKMWEFMKGLSVEVEFFPSRETKSIQAVEPFKSCESMSDFTALVKTKTVVQSMSVPLPQDPSTSEEPNVEEPGTVPTPGDSDDDDEVLDDRLRGIDRRKR
jgi:hypothetical protein